MAKQFITLTFYFLYIFSISARADDYMRFALEAKKNMSKMIAPYKEEAKRAHAKSGGVYQSQNEYQSHQVVASHSTIVIFVSFSMPDQSIVDYLRDARKINASVVIYGLINNSFKDTFIKMASLVKQADGGGVELNPPLFNKFNISKVPAVIVLPDDKCLARKKQKNCAENDFDIVYGDIPLFDALRIIRDHGSVSSKNAGELLARFPVYSVVSVKKESPHE